VGVPAEIDPGIPTHGAYPEVSLQRAREKRDEARQLVDRRIDPGSLRKAHKQVNVFPDPNRPDNPSAAACVTIIK
jgi:hypothetical protein